MRGRTELTGSALSSTLARWTQPGFIKSVQRGTVTITTALTGTATITAVDVSNSVIRYLGNTTDQGTAASSGRSCRVALTNGTTVTATSGNAGNSYLVNFEVTEYFPGVIKSVQRSTIATAGTTATATITTVVMLKSEVSYLGMSTAIDDNANSVQVTLVLTNATTVTATHNAGGTNTTGFQVVEYF